jgi:DNA primase
MNIQQLTNFLELHLGSGLISNDKTQIKFYCPFCKHYKQKLEICIDENSSSFGYWNCWVCGMSKNSKGKTISSLFKRLNFDNIVLNQLHTILGDGKKINIADKSKNLFKEQKVIDIDKLFDDKKENINDFVYSSLKLPDEYKPLWIEYKGLNPEYRNAKYYLKKRGVTDSDILRYKIGYCEDGLYSGMIIIPSYNENNQLNFFYGRAYYEDANIKHKLPDISKNFIGFENSINWNLPIIIVEGAFDAIAVKRNAIPLFGKIISNALKQKIVTQKVKKVYIALDEDAIKDSIHLIEYFMNNGIEVYFIQLKDKDPSKIGFKKFTQLKNNTITPLTQISLLKLKAK